MPEHTTPEHSNREVLRLAAPIGLAFVPLGMALGLLIVHAGLAWWWAPVFAAVIYAGSLEFLMVGLAATAAPVAAVALTTFIVNSRHVFYALSFPLDRVRASGPSCTAPTCSPTRPTRWRCPPRRDRGGRDRFC